MKNRIKGIIILGLVFLFIFWGTILAFTPLIGFKTAFINVLSGIIIGLFLGGMIIYAIHLIED